MEITRIDVDDDAAMHAGYDVLSSAMREGREQMPLWQRHEWLAAMRSPDSGERAEHYLARDADGRAVGLLDLYFPLLDNLSMLYLNAYVAPGARRQGVGRALLELAERQARDAGRTQLLADSKLPGEEVETHPYRLFATACGYELSNVEVVRHQALPVPTERLDAWAAEAAERAEGYELATYVNDFPTELAPSLCTLLGQLAVDAPTGSAEFEEEVMTPERLRERHATCQAMGREAFETVAVKDGVVAAQTTLAVSTTKPEASQWGTFVHREHRGHSLGLAVKAANLRAVQAAHPHLTRANTQNAESNQWMIAINERMGFRVVEASAEFLKRI